MPFHSRLVGLLLPSILVVACSSSTQPVASAVSEADVVKGYVSVGHESYEASVSSAEKLKQAVDAFVASPNQALFDAAKKAWLDSRPAYIQTEAFRFYGGPIDGDNGPEAEINSWPLDEQYIDYVDGADDAGIINNPTAFPEITKSLLQGLNQKNGEANVATGFHAIEFLLWGQDTSETGPGARPFTDFVDGGTAKNQARRRAYLKACAELLVEQLDAVEAEWEPGIATSYAAKLTAGDPKAALGNVLKGIGALAATELSRERMNTAYSTKDQEEEHSCFSDTTHTDHLNDIVGVENIYFGRYGSFQGTGLDKLVASKSPELDKKMQAALKEAHDAIAAIPAPFDQAILGDDSAPGRVKLKAAIDKTKAVGSIVVEMATLLGVTINLEN